MLMSKIVHLASITNIPTSTKKEFDKYKKNLFVKIKITTSCNSYDNGKLKNVNISSKIISLQYFCI